MRSDHEVIRYVCASLRIAWGTFARSSRRCLQVDRHPRDKRNPDLEMRVRCTELRLAQTDSSRVVRSLRRSPGEWPVAVKAAVLLAAFAVLLRVAPGWTLRHTASIPRQTRRKSGVTLLRVSSIVDTLSGFRPLSRGCLPRALTTLMLARRAGWDPRLVIGVTRAGDGMLAHAWIECEGSVVPLQDLGHYSPLWTSA